MFFSSLALMVLNIIYLVMCTEELTMRFLELIMESLFLIYQCLLYVQYLCLWRLTQDLCVISHEWDKYFFKQEYSCPPMCGFKSPEEINPHFNFTSFQSEWIG